jgi:hypothetical protein
VYRAIKYVEAIDYRIRFVLVILISFCISFLYFPARIILERIFVSFGQGFKEVPTGSFYFLIALTIITIVFAYISYFVKKITEHNSSIISNGLISKRYFEVVICFIYILLRILIGVIRYPLIGISLSFLLLWFWGILSLPRPPAEKIHVVSPIPIIVFVMLLITAYLTLRDIYEFSEIRNLIRKLRNNVAKSDVAKKIETDLRTSLMKQFPVRRKRL